MAYHENTGKCGKCQQMMYDGLSDPEMRTWFEAEQLADPTLHLSQTYRGKDEQNADFARGVTKARYGKSPHGYKPCVAFDVFYMVNGKDASSMAKYKALADRLPDTIEWGGLFRGLADGPHFQRVGWKTLVKNYPNGS